MGTGYVMFSCAVALLTFAAPRVANKHIRNVLTYILVTVSGYLVFQMFKVRAVPASLLVSDLQCCQPP
jgi:hypothetical protein